MVIVAALDRDGSPRQYNDPMIRSL